MADAEKYARWLVDNQDKKGSPEFDTVAQAYKAARATPAPAAASAPQPAAGSEPIGVGPITPTLMQGNPFVTAGKFGPFGVAPFLLAEGYRQGTEALSQGAYNLGGAATETASGLGASPEVAGGVGTGVNFLTRALTAYAGGKIGQEGSKPLLQPMARSLMQKAVKPSMANPQRVKDAGVAVNTMLEKGIPASKGGMEKLDELIDVARQQVDDLIDAIPPGTQVNRGFVRAELLNEVRKINQRSDPGSDIRTVAGIWRRIKGRFDELVPLERAQQAKVADYQWLRQHGAYTKDVNPAQVAGREAAARGWKKAIEDKIPEIRPANRELGNLLTTRNVVAPKLATRQNNDVVGAFAPIAFGAARNDALGAGMAAVTLADRNPFIKSYLAHKLFQGRPGYYGGLLGGAYAGGADELLDLIYRNQER